MEPTQTTQLVHLTKRSNSVVHCTHYHITQEEDSIHYISFLLNNTTTKYMIWLMCYMYHTVIHVHSIMYVQYNVALLNFFISFFFPLHFSFFSQTLRFRLNSKTRLRGSSLLCRLPSLFRFLFFVGIPFIVCLCWLLTITLAHHVMDRKNTKRNATFPLVIFAPCH